MNRPGMFIGAREFEVSGAMLKVGDPAPDFRLTGNDWGTRTLASYEGKIKIISVVPSLDTRVCSAQTRRFNQAATEVSDEIVILTVSADLPYAQQRWCGAEGITSVETLSDHRDVNFGASYGFLVDALRILQRGVIVLDRTNVVCYAEYVPIIGNEVNFDGALEVARSLV